MYTFVHQFENLLLYEISKYSEVNIIKEFLRTLQQRSEKVRDFQLQLFCTKIPCSETYFFSGECKGGGRNISLCRGWNPRHIFGNFTTYVNLGNMNFSYFLDPQPP